MKFSQSILGWILAFLYIFASAYLIISQGLFGESFIALILGLPWSMIVIFSGELLSGDVVSTLLIYFLVLLPIALNAYIFYWIGAGIQNLFWVSSEPKNKKNISAHRAPPCLSHNIRLVI